MERLRHQINIAAATHYQNLTSVAISLDSILFSHQKPGHAIPFGSFVNGTYHEHSDIDVYIVHTAKAYWKVLKLQKRLEKNYGIEIIVTGNILFFDLGGVKVNVVVGKPHRIAESETRDKKIRDMVARYPLYRDVVRFLKLFAETYIERFPFGRTNSKPMYPGAHFYTIVAALALDILTDPLTIKAYMKNTTYSHAIMIVANFIGEDKYMAQQKILADCGVDPTEKFINSIARENFNRCFRALVAHITRGVPLPNMNIHSIPIIKPTNVLLMLTNTDEALREAEKRREEERIAREERDQLLAKIAALSLSQSNQYSKNDEYQDKNYYNFYDDSNAYVASNGNYIYNVYKSYSLGEDYLRAQELVFFQLLAAKLWPNSV